MEQKESEAYFLTYGKKVLLIGLFVLGMAFAEGSANDWLPIVMVDGHQQSAVTGSIYVHNFCIGNDVSSYV